MTITDPAYVDAFGDGNTGALLAQVLTQWHGFGKFILVLLAMSVIGMYSGKYCKSGVLTDHISQQHP